MQLQINGKIYEIADQPNRQLLWVLRDELGMMDTKYSCGMGNCGTCTILLDGKPIKSCVTLISRLAGKNITTFQGMVETAAAEDGIHRLLHQAFLADVAPQCEWCMPAQMLAASALLTRNPHPSDSEIELAMNDVLCRCGNYHLIYAAVRRASDQLPKK
jgi:isoquinoline 1-oxidoreductase subunit alpha